MFSEQETMTDQLVSIIRHIQLKRGTGTLSAIRGEDATIESGTIVFVRGKVVQADTDCYHDREALNWLSTWNTCRVAFVPATGSEDIPLSSGPRFLPSNANMRQIPESMHRENDLFSKIGITPIPDNAVGNLNTPTSVSAPHQIFPYRSKPPNIALYLIKLKGLSRSHRRLFLLIDGTHNLAELANLLNRNQFDALTLLYDLQMANCIIIPSPHKSGK
jgi:hypothetical protein